MKIFYERTITCECGFEFRQTTLSLPLDEIGDKVEKQSARHFVDRVKERVYCGEQLAYSEWSIVVPDRDYFSPPNVTRKRKKRVQYTLEKLHKNSAG